MGVEVKGGRVRPGHSTKTNDLHGDFGCGSF